MLYVTYKKMFMGAILTWFRIIISSSLYTHLCDASRTPYKVDLFSIHGKQVQIDLKEFENSMKIFFFLRSNFYISSATLIKKIIQIYKEHLFYLHLFSSQYVRMGLLQVFIAKCELIENRNTLVVINQFLGKAWFGQLEIVHFPPFFLALNLGLIFSDVTMIFK